MDQTFLASKGISTSEPYQTCVKLIELLNSDLSVSKCIPNSSNNNSLVYHVCTAFEDDLVDVASQVCKLEKVPNLLGTVAENSITETRSVTQTLVPPPDPKALTPQEKDRIMNYSLAQYISMNTYLRSGGSPSQFPDIVSLSQALDKLPPFSGTTYRGAMVSDIQYQVLMKLKKGEIVSDPPYVSTSQKESISDGFLGSKKDAYSRKSIKFQIKGYSGRDISPFVEFSRQSEREVLFPLGAKFKVVSVSIDAKWR